MTFYIKKINVDAVVPSKGSSGSAGRDLSSIEDIVIPAGEWRAVATGLSIEIPEDYYARIAPRSGLAFKNGIFVNAGVIDSDYRGEIKVILYNAGVIDFSVKKFDRIAQMILEKIYNGDMIVIDELSGTGRGSNGFGSTGLQ